MTFHKPAMFRRCTGTVPSHCVMFSIIDLYDTQFLWIFLNSRFCFLLKKAIKLILNVMKIGYCLHLVGVLQLTGSWVTDINKVKILYPKKRIKIWRYLLSLPLLCQCVIVRSFWLSMILRIFAFVEIIMWMVMALEFKSTKLLTVYNI